MNRPLSPRDRGHRSAATIGASRFTRAVSRAIGLELGIAPHVRTYRNLKRADNNRPAGRARIATGAPRLAHVRERSAAE
jgi:hypothetical protein